MAKFFLSKNSLKIMMGRISSLTSPNERINLIQVVSPMLLVVNDIRPVLNRSDLVYAIVVELYDGCDSVIASLDLPLWPWVAESVFNGLSEDQLSMVRLIEDDEASSIKCVRERTIEKGTVFLVLEYTATTDPHSEGLMMAKICKVVVVGWRPVEFDSPQPQPSRVSLKCKSLIVDSSDDDDDANDNEQLISTPLPSAQSQLVLSKPLISLGSQSTASHQIKHLSCKLSPSCWVIAVKLLDIHKVFQSYYCAFRSGNDDQLVRLLLQDESGLIEAVAFRDIEKEYGLIREQSYIISGAKIVRRLLPEQRAWPDRPTVIYDLLVERFTRINPVMAVTDTPPPPISSLTRVPATLISYLPVALITPPVTPSEVELKPMDKVALAKIDARVSFVSVVNKTGPQTFELVKGKQMPIRRIEVVDHTRKVLECALWGAEAVQMGFKIGDILLCRDIVVRSYFNNFTLNKYKESSIEHLTDSSSLPEYTVVRDWWAALTWDRRATLLSPNIAANVKKAKKCLTKSFEQVDSKRPKLDEAPAAVVLASSSREELSDGVFEPEETSAHLVLEPEETSAQLVFEPEPTSAQLVLEPEETSAKLVLEPEETSAMVTPTSAQQADINNNQPAEEVEEKI